MTRRRERLWLAAICASALLLRLGLSRWSLGVWPDSYLYLDTAERIATRGWLMGINPSLPSLYPLLIALARVFIEEPLRAAQAVSIGMGALAVLPAYLLGRRIHGPATGLLAACGLALSPLPNYYAVLALAETTYIAVFATAVYLTLAAAEEGGARRAAWAGAAWGLAYLARTEGLCFIAPAALLFFVLRRRGPQGRIGPPLLQTGALMLAGLLVAAPHLLAIRRQTGAWSISTRMSIYFDFAPRGIHARSLMMDGHEMLGDWIVRQGKPVPRELPRAQAWGHPLEGGLCRRAATVLRNLYRQYHTDFAAHFSFLAIFLAGVGFLAPPWEAQRLRAQALLGCFIAANLLGYAFLQPSVRCLTPLEPLFMVFVGYGAIICGERLGAAAGALGIPRFGPRHGGALCALALAFPMLSATSYPLRRPAYEEPQEYRRAGEWLRRHHAAAMTDMTGMTGKPLVLGRPEVAVFAGGSAVQMPAGDRAAVLRFARWQQVDYVVSDERTLKRSPEPSDLAADIWRGAWKDDLEELYRSTQPPGCGIAIFRLRKEPRPEKD